VVPAGGGAYFFSTEEHAHLVVLPNDEREPPPDARPFRASSSTSLTAREQERLSKGGGILMKPPCEERLHKYLCDQARWQAHQIMAVRREFRARPFRGDLKAGIHWRRTLRERARGGTQTYVRQRIRDLPLGCGCDECPVVWVFDASVPVVSKVSDYFPDDSNFGQVYSSFFWFSDRNRESRVTRSEIACLVRLNRNVTPSWDKALVKRLLFDRLPEDRRCRASPWYDDELPDGLKGPDLAVACAVRWGVTDHVVIVRVDQGYRVNETAVQYAADRGIRLVDVHPSSFHPILLKRYRIDHEVPSKGDWHPPNPLAMRFVEPVPGLESNFRMNP
jgi:hypothetical protein